MKIKPLLTALLFSALLTTAQEPMDITPKLDGIVRYQRIATDKKGTLYTVVFRNYSEVRVMQYTKGEWKDISAGMPPIRHTSKLMGTANGVVFSGHSKDFERLMAIWDGTAWTALPLQQLRGKVNSFSVDANGLLWVTGAFGEGGKTYLLATWENGRFKVQGPPMELEPVVEMVMDGSYGLYTSSVDNVTQFIQVPNKVKGKQQYFVVTEGDKWGYMIKDSFPLNFSEEMAVAAKTVFVVQSCGGVKNKCLLYWDNRTWQLMPFDDAYKHDEVFCMTTDGEGNLLTGGMTRTSKGYVVLKWSDDKWSSFGPPIDKPIQQMTWLEGKVYAVTGAEAKTITVITPGAATVSPDPAGKYLVRDAKAGEVWAIADAYWTAEKQLVREVSTQFQQFSSPATGTNYSYLAQALQKKCDSLSNLNYDTYKKLDALKLKTGKNVLADQLQGQLTQLSHTTTFIQATIKGAIDRNRADYDKFMKLAWESIQKLKDLWVMNHVFSEEYKRRNSL